MPDNRPFIEAYRQFEEYLKTWRLGTYQVVDARHVHSTDHQYAAFLLTVGEGLVWKIFIPRTELFRKKEN